MLMKAAPALLGLALSTCPFGGETPGGYARIVGTVRTADGSPYRGGVFIVCGGSGWDRQTDSRGRYVAEYTVRFLDPAVEDAEGEFLVQCRVNAPAGRPPFAVRYETVPFTRERGDRVTTRIDLVEGEVQQEPQS